MKTETLVDELLETMYVQTFSLRHLDLTTIQSVKYRSPRTPTSSATTTNPDQLLVAPQLVLEHPVRSTTIRTRGSSGSSFTATEATDTLVGTTDGTLERYRLVRFAECHSFPRSKGEGWSVQAWCRKTRGCRRFGCSLGTRSTSKNRRSRVCRSVKPVEETIEEGMAVTIFFISF